MIQNSILSLFYLASRSSWLAELKDDIFKIVVFQKCSKVKELEHDELDHTMQSEEL